MRHTQPRSRRAADFTVAVSSTTNRVRFVSTYFGVTNMNSCQATWEDAENNRRVELVVNYRLDATRVEINDVTPTRVTFLCPTSGNPTRSIGVWTNGGRRVLSRQIKDSGRLNSLKQEIAEGRVVEIKHTTPKAAGKQTPVLTA
jgi:hypothetical protein